MTNLTTTEMLMGLKCCALWLTIIGVLLMLITILLAIIVYQNRKKYLELRYMADRINAIFEMKNKPVPGAPIAPQSTRARR